MVKAIIRETFEQMGEIPKQVVKQTAKLPGEIIHGAVRSVVGGKSGLGLPKRIDPLTGIEIPSQQRVKQLKKQEAKKKAAIPYIKQIIYGGKKSSEPPGYEDKLTKMQELKPAKKELPPPVSASKPKMGTGERRLGVSG